VSPKTLTVRDVMTANPLTLSPEDTLMDAVQTMRLRGIRRIPIVIGDKLVGLLAEGDLKRAEPSTLSDTQEHFNQVMEGTPVSRIMIHDPVTTTADTPLREAVNVLYTNKYGALPVVEGERVVGILTDYDLIGAFLRSLSES
jgi:CBS domain-containing protein